MKNDIVFHALSGSDGVSSYLGDASQREELFGLFFFLADNTSIEWAFHYDNNNAVLGTTRKEDSTGNWAELGLPSRPGFSIHSHPGIRPTKIDEYFSIGLNAIDSSFKNFNPVIDSDWDNIQNRPESMAENYLIYFPSSNNFYRIGSHKRIIVKNGLFRKYRK